jgi:hypothetical protein
VGSPHQILSALALPFVGGKVGMNAPGNLTAEFLQNPILNRRNRVNGTRFALFRVEILSDH